MLGSVIVRGLPPHLDDDDDDDDDDEDVDDAVDGAKMS